MNTLHIAEAGLSSDQYNSARETHASALASIVEGMAPLLAEDGVLYGAAAVDYQAEYGGELERDEDGDVSIWVDEDEARDRMLERPLSVQVRSGWYSPGEEPEPEEYCILLGTGGPAVRIVGELGTFGEPSTAILEVQDWFTPWVSLDQDDEADVALLAFAQLFPFCE